MYKILTQIQFLALKKPYTEGENVWQFDYDFIIKTYRKSWLFIMETLEIIRSTGQEIYNLLISPKHTAKSTKKHTNFAHKSPKSLEQKLNKNSSKSPATSKVYQE